MMNSLNKLIALGGCLGILAAPALAYDPNGDEAASKTAEAALTSVSLKSAVAGLDQSQIPTPPGRPVSGAAAAYASLCGGTSEAVIYQRIFDVKDQIRGMEKTIAVLESDWVTALRSSAELQADKESLLGLRKDLKEASDLLAGAQKEGADQGPCADYARAVLLNRRFYLEDRIRKTESKITVLKQSPNSLADRAALAGDQKSLEDLRQDLKETLEMLKKISA